MFSNRWLSAAEQTGTSSIYISINIYICLSVHFSLSSIFSVTTGTQKLVDGALEPCYRLLRNVSIWECQSPKLRRKSENVYLLAEFHIIWKNMRKSLKIIFLWNIFAYTRYCHSRTGIQSSIYIYIYIYIYMSGWLRCSAKSSFNVGIAGKIAVTCF